MARPDRVPVRHPFDVMPHPVAVDDRPTSGLGDADHPSVDMCGHAGDEGCRGGSESLWPVGAHEVVVPADATGGNDDGLRTEFELADDVAAGGDSAGRVVGSQHRAAHTGHRAMVDDEVVHPMAGQVGDAAAGDVLPRQGGEGFDDTRARPPRDVEARDGVAVAGGGAVTALGPPDDREEGDTVAGQPLALLTGSPVDIGPGPLAAPVVRPGRAIGLGQSIPACAALPVRPGQVGGVLDAQPALFGAVDEEEPAEGPEGLATEVGFVLLVDEDHRAPGRGDLVGRDQTGQASSDDDDISVHAARTYRVASVIRLSSSTPKVTPSMPPTTRSANSASWA